MSNALIGDDGHAEDVGIGRHERAPTAILGTAKKRHQTFRRRSVSRQGNGWCGQRGRALAKIEREPSISCVNSAERAMVMNPHFLRLVDTLSILAPCAPTSNAFQLTRMRLKTAGNSAVRNGGSRRLRTYRVGVDESFLRRARFPVHREQLIARRVGKSRRRRASRRFAVHHVTGHAALQFAISNDGRADMIFAQQLYGLGRSGDVLWGISTSDAPKTWFTPFTSRACWAFKQLL
jgi:hypothetical protein